MGKARILGALLLASASLGQDTHSVPMLAVTSDAAVVPAHTRNVELRMALDPGTGRGDLLHIGMSDPGVRISLVLPDGKELTAETAKALGFEWQSIDGNELASSAVLSPFPPAAMHVLIGFPARQPGGVYVIRADASSVSADSVMMAAFLPLPQSAETGSPTVVAGLTTGKLIYTAGDSVEIIAIVRQGANPITDIKVTGQVWRESKDGDRLDPRPLSFVGGARPGDGSLSANVKPDPPGRYSAAVQITGTDSRGRQFSRNASTTFRVFPLRARLLGISDRAVRGNAGITQIEVTARLDVVVPGKFRLQFTLLSPDGKALTGSGTSTLNSGAQELTAAIPAKVLYQIFEQDGPYVISRPTIDFPDAEPGDEFVASSSATVQTQAYRLDDLDLGEYYIKRDIRAAGIDRQPSGKYGALRVEVTAMTPGGDCSWWGALSDPKGYRIDIVNGQPARRPPGLSTFPLDFHGAKIAHHGLNGSLMLSAFAVHCDYQRIQDDRQHKTQIFRADEFDNPTPDFRFVSPTYPAHARVGGKTWALPLIQHVGASDEPVQLAVRSSDPRIKPSLPINKATCTSDSACWHQGSPLSVDIEAAPDISPGRYPIEITGRLGALEHTFTFELTVDPVPTEPPPDPKAAMSAAISALVHDKEEPPDLPAPPAAPEEPTMRTPAMFTAGVALRKIHVILVLDRVNSMLLSNACEMMTASAGRFSRLFSDDRDSVGVISYGSTVQNTFPLSTHFGAAAPDAISKISCYGLTNTGEALKLARKELERENDPEAINAVILFTNQLPRGVTADWPLAQANNECPLDENGHRLAFLSPLPGQQQAAVVPNDGPIEDERSWIGNPPCGGITPVERFSFVPEQDHDGVSLLGTHELRRFSEGPLVGKIRMMSENVVNAALNQAENIGALLRSNPVPTYVYVLGFSQANTAFRDFATDLANEKGNPHFKPGQTSGLAIILDLFRDFWPGFQRIRADLLEHARLH